MVFVKQEPLNLEDRSEANLSQVVQRFKVVLFGLGKTIFAPPNQPALQILLQYRNIYEVALRDMQQRSDRGEPIPTEIHLRAVQVLDKMWDLVLQCMKEANKATYAQAKLIQAERIARLQVAPREIPRVPNPGFTQVPQDKPPEQPAIPAELVAPLDPPPDDLVVLDPADPVIGEP